MDDLCVLCKQHPVYQNQEMPYPILLCEQCYGAYSYFKKQAPFSYMKLLSEWKGMYQLDSAKYGDQLKPAPVYDKISWDDYKNSKWNTTFWENTSASSNYINVDSLGTDVQSFQTIVGNST